ncbi:Hypothetical protein Cul210931_1745 [Corynebacterium ulcerans]|uniref:Uncharacterized protein n=1 Tax=Corynebacterium ulcerans FRC58 TaxID=1408268 RepID=A0ABN4H280_CORUL|nr:Hypothetical protein Cul210932_1849 [Corynebacterium ulcerans]AIU31070.1 Hypothetical protein Cul210931_1745 [Corynebacterium ulcerans]AIU92394.1 Hypothetical protein Cul05146_1842 [Corynebacterium ulcerans]AKN77737.1 Hypothetical protein CulFRC58_1883 [Corynebacterium ulcerans FRC58]ALD95566.1 Hypothetical protein Cul131001_1881 [Corynebacterium ulcerans]
MGVTLSLLVLVPAVFWGLLFFVIRTTVPLSDFPFARAFSFSVLHFSGRKVGAIALRTF